MVTTALVHISMNAPHVHAWNLDKCTQLRETYHIRFGQEECSPLLVSLFEKTPPVLKFGDSRFICSFNFLRLWILHAATTHDPNNECK